MLGAAAAYDSAAGAAAAAADDDGDDGCGDDTGDDNNDVGAAVIWHGESEALYDTYNNKYVYVYEVNEEGLVSSITEYTDLLLSASSLLGQKINTNYKEK